MQNYLKITESIGIDEVGRGPLAGPVVAACVYTPKELLIPEGLPIIRDSKKMTHKNRVQVVNWIKTHDFIKYSIACASVEEIDQLNILQASLLAMKRAFNILSSQCNTVLIDGNKKPDINASDIQCIVGGDDKFLSIALASIIAKEYRDDIMKEIDALYPQYGFAKHVGYGTAKHIHALQQYGITEYHRKSFAPVRKVMNI